MLFNSIEFFIFFFIIITIYFILPHRFRWVLLLAGSYYFYMSWNPKYIVLIIFSTFVDYWAGILMGRQTEKKKRRIFLFASLAANLGLLFLFKYYNFFSDSFVNALQSFNKNIHLPEFNYLLPMGISFYTFQTLSYTIDVYRGEKKPEKHFGIFALYVSFFPQLVAGPIERSKHLLPQFYDEKKFDYNRITDGLKRMGIGLFKKVVIADNIAVVVNIIYNSPTNYKGLPLVFATILFAFQILCDFSGYSDMAIGAAKVLGFDLMENFKRPYFSKSISEFWKRWHISLSTWFKDYLYIPLGGNRVKIQRHFFNLFVTFLISGLWHGANWTFAVWGALHGFYLVAGIILRPIKEKLNKITKIDKQPLVYKVFSAGFTFALVCFAWIFFRANNISDAFYIIKNMFIGWQNTFSLSAVDRLLEIMKVGYYELVTPIIAICALLGLHLLERKENVIQRVNKQPLVARWFLYLLVWTLILIFGVFDGKEFIYFQF